MLHTAFKGKGARQIYHTTLTTTNINARCLSSFLIISAVITAIITTNLHKNKFYYCTYAHFIHKGKRKLRERKYLVSGKANIQTEAWWLALTVNLTQLGVIWETSLLIRRDCLHWVGLSALVWPVACLTLTDTGGPSPLWAAVSPRQGLLTV